MTFRARKSSQAEPYTHLGIDVSPEQKIILAPTIHDLSVQSILKDAGGSGATKNWRNASSTTLAPSTTNAGCRTTQRESKSCSLPSS